MKNHVKITLWLVFGLIFLIGGGWSLAATSSWAARARQQADPASALNLPPDVPPAAQADLVWLPDDADTGREMEPFTRRQIESAYLSGWGQWNESLALGEPVGLATYFVGPGLTAVRDNIAHLSQSGFRVAQRNDAHMLQLHFYAADGSIVAFTDTRAEILQLIEDGAGTAVSNETYVVRISVIMFLEDGNWRIRHWVWQE